MSDGSAKVNEQYLRHIVQSLGDSALLMGVMQTRFAGGKVSDAFLDLVLKTFADEDLIFWLLDGYYAGPLPESFLVKFSNTFGSSELLKKLMAGYYRAPVSERFLCYIIDCLEDKDLLLHVLDGYYKGQKLTEVTVSKADEVFGSSELTELLTRGWM